jgi:AraC-like DNA-binding protein
MIGNGCLKCGDRFDLIYPMPFHTHIPHAPLSEFVELFWLYQGPRPAHSKERILPSGTPQIIINLRQDALRIYEPGSTDRVQSFRRSLLSGARSEFCVIDTASQESIMGIHFKPGGAFPFFRLPASEVHNAHVSLDALWGEYAADLRDQLLEAPGAEARFRILEQALWARVDHPLVRHPAVAYALKEFQGAPPTRMVSDVIGQIGLSPRRFIEIFSEEVGLTPKLFCRIQRFQRILRRVATGRQVEWADVACACGYFDQAHFIHDFQAFSGLNPTSYLSQKGSHPNHVPLQG